MNLLAPFKDLFHLFFPRECPGCGKLLLESEKSVCIDCLVSIGQTEFDSHPADNELYFRLAGLGKMDGAACLYFFDKGGRLQKLIAALKYHNQPGIGDKLGKFYGRILLDGNFLEGIKEIIPVPLHPKREMERGYNQAEEFGKGLSLATGIPLNSHSLKRAKATRTQTKKGKEARWQDMKNRFVVDGKIGDGVLLVDDVITTGSTILGCIQALENSEYPPSIIKVAGIGMTKKLSG